MLNNHQYIYIYKKHFFGFSMNGKKLHGQKAARAAEHSTKRGTQGGLTSKSTPPGSAVHEKIVVEENLKISVVAKNEVPRK